MTFLYISFVFVFAFVFVKFESGFFLKKYAMVGVVCKILLYMMKFLPDHRGDMKIQHCEREEVKRQQTWHLSKRFHQQESIIFLMNWKFSHLTKGQSLPLHEQTLMKRVVLKCAYCYCQ